MGHDEQWKRAAALMASREEYNRLPREVRGQLIQDIRATLCGALGLPVPTEKEVGEYGYEPAIFVPSPADGYVIEGVSPPDVVASARRRGVCVYTKASTEGKRCSVCGGPDHEMSCL